MRFQKNPIIQYPRAQSTVDYILLLVAVLSILIIFINPSSPFRSSVEETINMPAFMVENLANSVVFP